MVTSEHAHGGYPRPIVLKPGCNPYQGRERESSGTGLDSWHNGFAVVLLNAMQCVNKILGSKGSLRTIL